MTAGRSSDRDAVRAVLRRESPGRVVFAPNLWQWFEHHRAHGKLPREIADCASQLELFRHLGVDVFSRNVYADPKRCWFGGLAEEVWDGVEVDTRESAQGDDLVMERSYRTRAGVLRERQRGVLRERQRHDHGGSTLLQESFLVEDLASELRAFEEVVRGRRWRFDARRYQRSQELVGDDGVVMAGELFSPLKLLHMALGVRRRLSCWWTSPRECPKSSRFTRRLSSTCCGKSSPPECRR